MGEHGPIPNRSDQRRRRNKPEVEIESVEGTPPDEVEIPAPDELWYPAAKKWYEALSQSAQKHWYEPSDWAQAWVLAELLSREMYKEKPSSVMIQAWLSGAAELLTTEGARRRLRIEIAKGTQADPDDELAAADLDAYRLRLAT